MSYTEEIMRQKGIEEVVAQWGVNPYATVSAIIATEVMVTPRTAEYLLQAVLEDPECPDLTEGQLAELVGQILAIPLIENPCAGVVRLESGVRLFAHAREVRRLISGYNRTHPAYAEALRVLQLGR